MADQAKVKARPLLKFIILAWSRQAWTLVRIFGWLSSRCLICVLFGSLLFSARSQGSSETADEVNWAGSSSPSVLACLGLARKQQCSLAEGNLLQLMKAACVKSMADFNCPQLFKSATPAEKSRFLDCDVPEDLCGQTDHAVKTCADSARVAIVDFGWQILTLPANLLSAARQFPERFRRCQEDLAYKKELLGPFRPSDMSEETITRMSCADIRKFVQIKADLIFQRLDERVTQATLINGGDRVGYAGLQLTELEMKALAWDFEQPAPYRQSACYTVQEKIRFACSETTTIGANLALGMGTGSGVKAVARLAAAVRGAEAFVELTVPAEIASQFPDLRFTVFELDDTLHYQFRTVKGKSVSFLETQIEGNKLVVARMKVRYKQGWFSRAKYYRGKGLARAMVEQVLRDHPQITEISTEMLSETNRKKFLTALHGGLSPEEAIRETVAYKIRKKLGFGEIVPGSVTAVGGFKVRGSPQFPPPLVVDAPVVQAPIAADASAPGAPAQAQPTVLVVTPELDQQLQSEP